MASLISIKDFNITEDQLKHDLSKYYNSITSSQRSVILKKYSSIEDYINILYFLKFINKLDYNEISIHLGLVVQSVYKIYVQLGWNYSEIFEENESFQIKISHDLAEYKNKALKCNSPELNKKVSETIENVTNIRSDSYHKLGFDTFEEYVKVLYYLTLKEGLSSGEISMLLKCNIRNLQIKLKQLGLNRSRDEAQKIIIERNRRDYSKVQNTGRKTTLKHFLKSGLLGSKNENVIRTLLESSLPAYFDTNRYDIVIGLNTRNIIPPKEVDIPVIVIDNSTGKVFKIAIEYNGVVFHDEQRDTEKELILYKRGWVYYAVKEFGNSKLQNDYGSIKSQLERICFSIQQLVKVDK